MKRNKDFDNFAHDASDAGRIIGSHIPGVKQAIESYEIAHSIHRLSRSGPKAAKAAKRQVTSSLNQKRLKIVRRIQRRTGLRW